MSLLSGEPRSATVLAVVPTLALELDRATFSTLLAAHPVLLDNLVRLLRMAGFDTLYRNDYADREVVELATHDGRVVLTRDRDLLKRGAVRHGCYLRATIPAAQLHEVVARYGLAGQFRPFSLCTVCNLPLRPVAREAVLERLPASVKIKPLHFTTCDACGRIYWEGSHWRRMRALLDAAESGGGGR